MSHRKRVNPEKTELAHVQFQNLFAQLIALVMPRRLFAVLGRGSAKTTDVQVERLIEVMYDMPGAPCVWVADTFSNLAANILPAVLEGLERKGFKEGVHYVVEKEPPTFTEREKEKLPGWLKPHFWKPFNRLVSYKRTIVFFTGMNIRFGSLDRPSTLAGASYVYVFGDEAKYFKEEKIANLMKAVRGYRTQYGNSVFYRGCSFTTDMPDTSHVGEDDWILRECANMNVDALLLVIKTGLVANEALHEYVAAKEEWLKNKSMENLTVCRNKLRTANLWRARWKELRLLDRASTLFIQASSYVNADILTEGWFADAIAARLNDLQTAILSRRPTLQSGDRFYSALAEHHFYFDGIDEGAYERFGLLEKEDCRVLRYLNRKRPLMLGVDFGNMCSLSIAQEDTVSGEDFIRIVKFMYTLAPEYIAELGQKFRDYFAPMECKVVQLYYDRAGNSYKKVGLDQAGQLKKAIEFDERGMRTGWVVTMMSMNQGNIGQPEEYAFMQVFLGGKNPALPGVLIDAYAAKILKLSLENARTIVKSGIVYKDKRSEKLPIDQLPRRSTNPSDSFKYLVMTKRLRAIVKGKAPLPPAIADPLFRK